MVLSRRLWKRWNNTGRVLSFERERKMPIHCGGQEIGVRLEYKRLFRKTCFESGWPGCLKDIRDKHETIPAIHSNPDHPDSK